MGRPAGESRHNYHFHTGRPLARRLGYDEALVAAANSPRRRSGMVLSGRSR
jgi:hypothetical protein